MTPNDTHREQLSALVDGALDADQSRFLLRRLQHDDALAECLSRWQVIGDVLRDQAQAPAPAGFAAAIAARIADEPLPQVEGEGVGIPQRAASTAAASARSAGARGARWRWFGGGALAASLAIASVLALRPQTSPLAPADLARADAASPTSPVVAGTASGNDLATATPEANDTQPDLGQPTTSASTAPVVRRAANPVRVARAAPSPVPVASERTRDAEAELPRVILPAEAAARTAQAEPSTPAADPFKAPAAKAWPRAVIPGAGSGTFNASFDSGASYYPFDPSEAPPANQD